MSILKLEEDFSRKFLEFSENLNVLFEELTHQEYINLEKNEVSKAILIRLKYYFEYLKRVKKLLNKRRAPPAADFFVETIVFYLKAIFKIYKLPLQVHSERQIKRKRGAIRPDISIWNNEEEVVAIIECKTQLGWKRHNWKDNFTEREKKLKKGFPNALAFLIVMTSSNWAGFGEDRNVGKKYFCLSNAWPTEINVKKSNDYLLNPIEPMLLYFIQRYKEI